MVEKYNAAEKFAWSDPNQVVEVRTGAEWKAHKYLQADVPASALRRLLSEKEFLKLVKPT